MAFSYFPSGLCAYPISSEANIFVLTRGIPDPKTPIRPNRRRKYRPSIGRVRIFFGDLYVPTQKYRFAQTLKIRRRAIPL